VVSCVLVVVVVVVVMDDHEADMAEY